METSTVADCWAGCYADSWQGIITPESFAHPAKMAFALTRRIFEHARDEGWITPGCVVVDPFGGIGSTGIVGAEAGCEVVMCELEERFVKLNNANIEKHRWRWQQFGRPIPRVVHGDSRRLREVLGAADFVVSSPPYAECLDGKNQASNADVAEDMRRRGWDESSIAKATGHTGGLGYGQTPGQLGAMKAGDVAAVVGSPPFEGSLQSRPVNPDSPGDIIAQQMRGENRTAGGAFARGLADDYGTTEGQLGNQTGPTFWEAARDILRECYAILRPGGVAIWVCKDFVRKGERVPFSDDWLRLCESVGFTLACRHRAMLVAVEEHPSLFGDEPVTKKRERKSFFRRLAEKKGSPEINWEDVICVRKT